MAKSLHCKAGHEVEPGGKIGRSGYCWNHAQQRIQLSWDELKAKRGPIYRKYLRNRRKGKARMAKAIKQLKSKRGEYYIHWLDGMANPRRANPGTDTMTRKGII